MRTSSSTQFINSTKYGAQIEGSEFMELEKVMDVFLEKDIVPENWYSKYERQKHDYISINKNVEFYKSFMSFSEGINSVEDVLEI